MNPLFSLGGSQMALDSALEIIKLAGKANAPTIPLDSIIDVTKLDPARLTKIAMETGNKKLYDIAWSLQSGKPMAKPKPTLPVVVTAPKESPKVSVMRTKKKNKTIDEIIAYVERYKNQTVLGIGLVLQRVYEIKDKSKSEKMITAKTLCQHWVQELWEDKRIPRSHKFFKGYDCTGMTIIAMEKKDDKRGTKPYTSGPLYVSIRDALQFCEKEGIIKYEGNTFGCTIKGADTHEKWKNIDEWLMDRILNAS